MMQTPPIITLLTDFGENDSYVGAMKGVLLNIAPQARLVDISHQVPPQDIQQAANILENVYPYYPSHTVHMIVVDPGVGSRRRPIAITTKYGKFVAPDNGVLTHVCDKVDAWQAVALENKDYWLPDPSHTFHGRDIFSPAAAHLASGVPLEVLGPSLEELVRIEIPPLLKVPNGVKGEVVRIDHFGNVMTNIKSLQWLDDDTLEFISNDDRLAMDSVKFKAAEAKVTFSWRTLDQIYQSYSQVQIGETLTTIGSSGEIEISVNQGNAQDKLAIKVGDPVTLLFG